MSVPDRTVSGGIFYSRRRLSIGRIRLAVKASSKPAFLTAIQATGKLKIETSTPRKNIEDISGVEGRIIGKFVKCLLIGVGEVVRRKGFAVFLFDVIRIIGIDIVNFIFERAQIALDACKGGGLSEF